MIERVLAGLLFVPFLLGAAAVPVDQQREVFSFTDSDIVEASALVVQDGLFLTSNDSGDTGRVFAVDPGTGETVGVTHWSDDPVDVEALAPAGNGQVWVGDIGDNQVVRDSVQVARVPVGRTDTDVEATTYDLVFPDGAQDAESLAFDPSTRRLYVASKSIFGGTLYAAPQTLSPTRPNRLEPVGDVLPIATDAAFFPDGRHLVVRDYQRAEVYSFPDLAPVASVTLPLEPQGEGIAVDSEGAVYVDSEGQDAPVLEVPLPRALSKVVAPLPSPSASATPGTLSRAGRELPEATVGQRSTWPWFLSGWIALLGIVVLMRSLRRR